MLKTIQRQLVLIAIISALAGISADAAELSLRRQCGSSGSVVTLGDVAEIYTADAKQVEYLAAIELFPAPSATQQRVLRVREIQDLLMLRGVNLTEHRFSGSSQVVVTSASEPSADGDQEISSSAAKRIQRRMQVAILQYIKMKTGSDEPRIVQFESMPAFAHAAASQSQQISISGGTAPWTGEQHFDVKIDSPEGPQRFTLDAQIIIPSLVVAASHSLSRGAVVRESDLVLVRDSTRDGGSNVYHAIEEVAGKQTTSAVPDGKIIAPDDLKAQVMVHKGDVVTVYARSAGIRARTTARARDDGSLGELVTIETMQERKPFQARVCGVRETEVLAQNAEGKMQNAE
jgi:flagella basal body P-ring formation protein FlgA